MFGWQQLWQAVSYQYPAHVQNDTLRGLDAHLFVELGVHERQLDSLAHLLNLCLKTSNVSVCLRRRLVQLHDVYSWIRIICEYTDNGYRFVVKKNRRAGLQKILVDKRHDRDVVLGSSSRGNDRVVVVDQLLEVTNAHGRASHVIHSASFIRITVEGISVASG